MTPEIPPNAPDPARPSPPSAPKTQPSPANLMEYLRQRMESMERELSLERERAREAENLLRQQDALRTEVDKQLKALLEQLKQEKASREHEEEKSRARGRIDSLEQRLDEMHRTWAGLLKDALAKREAGDASLATTGAAAVEGLKNLEQGVEVLRQDVRALQEALHDIPGKVLPRLRELQDQIPRSVERREEDERALAEKIQDMLSGLGRSVTDRLGEMDRRLSSEMEKERERLDSTIRERTLLSQALEEERHRIRQEYAKGLHSLQAQLEERIAGIGNALAQIQVRQTGSDQNASAVKEISERIHSILTQPEAAKEHIIADLEREKRDLLQALKERTEQVRRDAMERREVERSLGESLMELNRQLEAERSRHQQFDSQTGEFRLQIQALQGQIQVLQGQIELGQKATQAQEVRYQALAAERDQVVQALMAEAQKVQAQLQSKRESDQAWDERLTKTNQLLEEERNGRRSDANQIAELRAQVQTLTEHLTATLREKEKAEAQTVGWSREREEILAALRKKEEMIAMLSSTFQNMLKK